MLINFNMAENDNAAEFPDRAVSQITGCSDPAATVQDAG
jgi:hypothetical protein